MQILSVRSQGMYAVAEPRRALPPCAPAQPAAADRRTRPPQPYEPPAPSQPMRAAPPRGVFIDTYA